ncbi:hypothetical protein [Moorena producens]|uniref:hypothetical protein n=1 Tax=Moorena producens TaxID=1155739 RepID=UPI001314DE33|nr:hypothetical protein [Moorena producens]
MRYTGFVPDFRLPDPLFPLLEFCKSIRASSSSNMYRVLNTEKIGVAELRNECAIIWFC